MPCAGASSFTCDANGHQLETLGVGSAGVFVGFIPGLAFGLILYVRAKSQPVWTGVGLILGSLTSDFFALCVWRFVEIVIAFAIVGAVATLLGLGFGKWGGFIREAPKEPASPA